MAKIRMQILLDENQKIALEREAEAKHVSVGYLIREAVELYQKAQRETETKLTKNDAIWNLVGIARSDADDLSMEHDHYVYGTRKLSRLKKR